MKGVENEYTEEQLNWIKENCKKPRKELTQLLNKKFNTEFTQNAIAGLCQRNSWLTGRTGYFKKNHLPHNKGKKMDVGANRTSFKKGHVPKNVKPVGFERIDSEGYVYIKTEPGKNKFKLKHRLVYESHYGPIPDDSIITFKDGDKQNCAIENLECIKKTENLKLNQYRYSEIAEPIKPSVKALVKLEITMNEIQKVNKSS